MNAKTKAIKYLKKRHDINYISQPQMFSFNTEVEIAKGLDIAIEQAKKEVFDDIEDTYNCEGIDSAIIERIKKRHLGKNST